MPLISVIVPVYNSADTVNETVRSVLRQRCDAQIEVILVNDGSTDSTKNVIKQIAISNANVIVKNRKTGSGRPSIPRNEGLELSRGDFVCFMDSDDVMPTGYLSAALTVMQSEFDFVGSLKHPFSSNLPRKQNKNAFVGFLKIPKLVQSSKNVFTTSGLVIPRQLIGDMRFENIYLEDWRFLMQLYEKGARGRLLFKPRVFYRVHTKSLTPKNKKVQIKRVISVHKEKYGSLGAPFFLFGYFIFGGLKLVLESKLLKKA